MILTRKHELFLIQIGIEAISTAGLQLLMTPIPEEVPYKKPGPNKGKTPWNKGIKMGPRKRKGHNGHKWTPEQRRKFKATMKKIWTEKKSKSE
jgi:hypothetical protein